jgi:hypothetical protein
MNTNFISRVDLYVLIILGSASWLLWRIVDVITIGPVLLMLGSSPWISFSTTFILALMVYCTFSILVHIMQYVKGVFEGEIHREVEKKLSKTLPYLLALCVLYILALVAQSVWYMFRGY